MSAKEKKRGGCLKGIFWLLVICIVSGLIGFLYLTNQGADLTRDAITSFLNGFRPKQVVNTFNQWRDLQVQGNEGNILEVATATTTEKFTRESSFEMFGKPIPGMTTVSEITIPATYRYHIDLKGDWIIQEDGHRLHVVAPPVQPSLPVAFDSAMMEKNNPGWSKIFAGDNMKELEKTITASLASRATDPETTEEVKEEAKMSIAKFLQTWLIGEDQWKAGHFEEIIVYFEGEVIDLEDQSVTPDLKIGQPETVLP